ncbi:MAG TPA: VOC family protein [Ramlibacter sp.]|uniref:VOC family protein n=1 Tax=Ramlibacter sp. TaxID=1917967 RepID=UPI002CA68F13|nr:VOC family protein [Ramlibacter sp.]HVZ45828.1 VOC family protein [Ramlibacter sp.]
MDHPAHLDLAARRPDALGVHSVDRVVFAVPDLSEAQSFYRAFGLDTRRQGDHLDVYTAGGSHCWMSIHESGPRKQLQYLRLGAFAQDLEALREVIASRGIATEAHPLSDGEGLWLRTPDAVAIQIVAAPKVSPGAKTQPLSPAPVAAGRRAAPARSRVARVRPRTLSHVLLFTADVSRMLAFSREVLGLRLSDHSGDIIAFMHGAHGSDHHLIAFAKSDAPGLHHTSWDVGSIDEVGHGAEQMRAAGYVQGWGVGRHVLGSNYFYYVRDPWGSYAEYSFDIDFVPHDVEWPAADHRPEDSLYVWGPPPPDNFTTNYEPPVAA